MIIREYTQSDLASMIRIWNEVVTEGIAFPQEECLDIDTGAAFFASQSYSGVAAEPSTEKIDAGIIGDVNGDSKVDVTDATLLQQYLAEMAELSPAQLAVADTNGDGKIDVTDATAIQNYIAELIDHLGA